jgi:mono/diheme cytochrome c family protein
MIGIRNLGSIPAAVMRTASISFFIFWMAGCSAWGQAVSPTDDVRNGHHLAIMLCTACHVAAPDQPYKPTLDPPAPSFESIAQRADINADSLQHFLTTTHDGLDNAKGMPNPNLADFQVKAIVAYILSLRK